MPATRMRRLWVCLERLPGSTPVWHAIVAADHWFAAAQAARAGGCMLVSLWGTDRRAGKAGSLVVSAAFALPEGVVWLDLALAAAAPDYPDLSGLYPAAARMQRATEELLGVRPAGDIDTRRWLDHGAWTELYPLRRDGEVNAVPATQDYAFVRVEGDGVHEIPVGPVHAGTIEPGHFRFSVVGEKVLRLEERLGYVHKGIARRFTELAPLEAYRLAGRVSGDSTVAYTWAYCMALESAWACMPPPRALALRALMLERERVAN